jgi:hypothetical protein
VREFVFIPKGIPHNYHSGAGGAGLENYCAGVADVPKVGPISWELEQEIAKRFGQEFLDHLTHGGNDPV